MSLDATQAAMMAMRLQELRAELDDAQAAKDAERIDRVVRQVQHTVRVLVDLTADETLPDWAAKVGYTQ